VADAVRDACAHHGLSIEPLLGLIDAQSHNLYADPLADEAALERYCALTEGALFAHAGRILGTVADARLEAASAASGKAYGLARLLFTMPQALSRGRVPLPATRLEAAGLTAHEVLAGAGEAKLLAVIGGLQGEARACLAAGRQHVANLPREMRVAFLPLALVESYLRALGRSGSAPWRQAPRMAPLVRIVRIAAAHWLRGP
jgi:phytoene synthase